MDLATIIGLVAAWGALLTALLLEGGQLGDLWLLAPAVLVFGGTLGATCITVSLDQMKKLPVYIKLGLTSEDTDPRETIKRLGACARKARRDGLLGLESELAKTDNRFLRQGLELVVDGTPPELIREILETEVAAMMGRHKQGADMMATAGGFAPTMGIIGTVMGLIHMLKSLNEPSRMGPAIAAAFLATLYGVMVANMFFLPISNKLKLRSHQEAILYEMMIEGLLAIATGEGPRVVERKMLSYLPPELRGKGVRLAEPVEPRAASSSRVGSNRKVA